MFFFTIIKTGFGKGVAMKRLIVLCLCLFAIFVFAEETYKIYLNDGKVIISDVKPDVKGDRIYFERFGMLLYIPVDLVNLSKTEKGESLIQESQVETKKQKKVIKFNEEELEQIRQRSRLANEEELAALEYGSSEGGTGASGKKEGAVTGGDLQKKLATLMEQRSILQGNVNSLMEELSAKKDQFGFATMAADKERLQKEMTDLESKITEAKSKLSSVENQITATQQEIASTPVVIEAPTVQPSPQPQQNQTPPPTSGSE